MAIELNGHNATGLLNQKSGQHAKARSYFQNLVSGWIQVRCLHDGSCSALVSQK
jgi:hypothetical protein